MNIAKRSLIWLFTIGALVVAAAPHYHRTRPAVSCALPNRLYQFKNFSQPVRSLSAPATLIAIATATPPVTALDQSLAARDLQMRRTIKSFQFVENATLQIDHCSLSRMSVLLHASGDWSVSLRAEQNSLMPPSSPVDVSTNEKARKFTDHLQRNEFHIQVRCYAGHGPGDVDGLLGKPIVIPLNVAPFWVQKQRPYPLFATGNDRRIEDYFDLIDRVEIEFVYRNE